MKNQYQSYEEEIRMLSEQLDPREMFILGYLKGFDRKVMKEWDERGLWENSIELN